MSGHIKAAHNTYLHVVSFAKISNDVIYILTCNNASGHIKAAHNTYLHVISFAKISNDVIYILTCNIFRKD